VLDFTILPGRDMAYVNNCYDHHAKNHHKQAPQ